MPTNNFVEASFWNFDALFTAQSHPVRDLHDTFFISDPAITPFLPADYLQRVKTFHEQGGDGSVGWRYKWLESEARKNILRTHTTCVSTRMLYKLAQQTEFTPKKYFSIDRVYRNEALDATHLAEFHQIEGLVADYNINLAHLIGAIKQFFER
jgi:phenylalanyl-tRNA synthetase alpha chain